MPRPSRSTHDVVVVCLIGNHETLAASHEAEDRKIVFRAAIHELGVVFRACGAARLDLRARSQHMCAFGFGDAPNAGEDLHTGRLQCASQAAEACLELLQGGAWREALQKRLRGCGVRIEGEVELCLGATLMDEGGLEGTVWRCEQFARAAPQGLALLSAKLADLVSTRFGASPHRDVEGEATRVLQAKHRVEQMNITQGVSKLTGEAALKSAAFVKGLWAGMVGSLQSTMLVVTGKAGSGKTELVSS